MSKLQKEILEALDSLLFILKKPGSVINKKKSQFQPAQKIQLLGLVVISISMTFVFLENKIEALQTQFEKLINNPQTTVMELTQLLGNFFFRTSSFTKSLASEVFTIFQISALRELFLLEYNHQGNSCGILAEQYHDSILEFKFDAVSSRNRPVCIRT